MSHSASSDGKAKIKESGILPERLSISEGYRNLVYSTLGIWDMRADVAYKIRLRAKRYALDNHDLTISSTIKQNMLVFTVLASPFISVVGAKLNSPAFYVHGGLCTSDLKTKSWVPPWIMRKVKWLCAAADLAGLSLILFMPSQLTAILAIVLVIPSWLAGVLSEYSSVFAGYRSAQQQKVMASLGISLSGINAEAAEAAAQALAAVKTMSETAARAAQDAVQKGVAAYSDTFQETVSSKESPGPDDYLEAHGAGIEAAKAAFSGTAAAASPKQQAKAKAAKELCKFAEDLKKTLHPEIMEACKREETCQVVFDGPWSKKAEKLVEIMVGKGVNKMAQVFSDKAGLGNLSLKQHKLSSLGIPGLKDTKEGKALTKVLPKEAGDDE